MKRKNWLDTVESQPSSLYVKYSLHGFPCGETYCCHGYNFQIPYREADIEPSPATLAVYRSRRFAKAHPLIRSYEPAYLHSPSDHFKWIRHSLRYRSRNCTDHQVCNRSGWWLGRRI